MDFMNDMATEEKTTRKPNPFSIPVEQIEAGAAENLQQRQANKDYYGIQLRDDEYYELNKILDTLPDEEKENYAYSFALAKEYSNQLEIPFNEALQNIDQLNTMYFGNDLDLYPTRKSAFTAVKDSHQMGKNTLRMGELGNLIMQANTNRLSGGDITTDEQLKAYMDEYKTLMDENAYLQDKVPRGFLTNIAKYAAQSAPFTTEAIARGSIPVVGGLLSFQFSSENAAGLEYMDLITNGCEPQLAANIATISGGIQGVIELALGNVAGALGAQAKFLGKGAGASLKKSEAIKKLSESVAKKFHFNGTWRALAQTATQALEENIEEGTEEVLQQLTSYAGQYLADALSEDYEFNITPEEMKAELWENFKGGFAGSILLGLPTAGLNFKASLDDVKELKKAAETIPSKEAFFKNQANNPLFEGMDASTKAAAMEDVYAKNSSKREEAFKKQEADIAEAYTAEDIMEAVEVEEDQDGEVISEEIPEVYRDENGKLYTENQSTGDNKGRFAAGNPEGGKNYGYIDYTIDEEAGTVTIDNFKMASHREAIRNDLFIDFARDFSGYEIKWEPKGKLLNDVKATLLELNPQGKEKGLSFFGSTDENLKNDVDTKLNIAKELAEKTSLTPAQQKAFIALLDASGKNLGGSITEFVNRNFGKSIIASESQKSNVERNLKNLVIEQLDFLTNGMTEEKAKELNLRPDQVEVINNALKGLDQDTRQALADYALYAGKKTDSIDQETLAKAKTAVDGNEELKKVMLKAVSIAGQEAKGAAINIDDFRSVIYAGENADFSTFAHELAHIWRKNLSGDLLAEAEKAFGVKDGNWTRTDEENFARDFEQYLYTGKAKNSALRNIFQQLAQFLKDVYNSLKNLEAQGGIKLTDDIVSVFDKILADENSGLNQKTEAKEEEKTQAKPEENAAETVKAQPEEKNTTYDEVTQKAVNNIVNDPSLTEEAKNNAALNASGADVVDSLIDYFEQKANEAASEMEDGEIQGYSIDDDGNMYEMVFQLVGERAAAELDFNERRSYQASRMRQLERAQDFEAEGKSKEYIVHETGWQKNEDLNGTWWSEIKDGELKSVVNFTNVLNKIRNVMRLMSARRNDPEFIERCQATISETLKEINGKKMSDIYDAPELYKYYPALKDTEVNWIYEDTPIKGMFTPKGFMFNAKHIADLNQVRDVIIYEAQRIIQGIEVGDGGKIFAQNFQTAQALQEGMKKKFGENYRLTSYQASAAVINEYMKSPEFMQYETSPGAVQARVAVDRANMDELQRKNTSFLNENKNLNMLFQTMETVKKEEGFKELTEEEVLQIFEGNEETYNKMEGYEKHNEELFTKLLDENKGLMLYLDGDDFFMTVSKNIKPDQLDQGKWQLTYWDEDGPMGHTVFTEAKKGLEEMSRFRNIDKYHVKNENEQVFFQTVTDPEELEWLNSQETVKAYRAAQLIDGKIYPPMSAAVNGKLRDPIELNTWERSDENPELADDNGFFKLNKGNKKSIMAKYNPYFHSSPTMLNDQFSEAQTRPNLITLEVEIPASELNGDYKAEKAKDSVGTKEWKAGIIQSQLTGTRTVNLSRWDKPLRIVPNEEVARNIVESFNGKDIVMPSNVVPPAVREELEKLGVKFVETNNKGILQDGENTGKHYSKVYANKQNEMLYQLIGYEGAAALDEAEDKTERIDNLNIAQEMEASGKDKKAIRLATGWEKGADKKWKYEIDDLKAFNLGDYLKQTNDTIKEADKYLKNAVDDLMKFQEEKGGYPDRGRIPGVKYSDEDLEQWNFLNDIRQKAEINLNELIEEKLKSDDLTLKDLLKNTELLKAYPELGDIKINIEFAGESTGGYYSAENNTIVLNSKIPSYEYPSILLHEVQHAIQEIEGFAKGGDPETVNQDVQKIKDAFDIVAFYWEVNDKYKEDPEKYAYNQAQILADIKKEYQEADVLDWLPSEDIMYKAFNYWVRGYGIEEQQKLVKDNGLYDHTPLYSKNGLINYKHLAGEVEARNVQARMNFTTEQRRNQLLEDTEDVVRKEQIVLFQAKKTEAELAKDIDALLEASKTQQDKKIEYIFGSVTAPLVENARKHGIDIEGYEFEIDNSAIRHIKNGHGKAANEAELGQIAINDDDFRKIPNVLRNPDYLIYGSKTKAGVETIVFVKNEEGSTIIVEEIRNRGKHLATHSMYKLVAASDAYTLSRNPTLYVRNDRNNIEIVDVKNEIVNQNILLQTTYHGTSADFDEFDLSYGLSGEGSMSFGYGTYVTASEAIARDYAERQTADKAGSYLKDYIEYDERNIADKKEELEKFPALEEWLKDNQERIESIKQRIERKKAVGESTAVLEGILKAKIARNSEEGYSEERNKIILEIERYQKEIDDYNKQLEEIAAKGEIKRNLYTVEIPDTGFIKWDKNVRQSTVNKIHEALFRKLAYEPNEYGEYDYKGVENELRRELDDVFNSDFTGQSLYGTVSAYLGGDKQASELLYSIGYKGIDYPAGTNFGTPEKDARNFVIFKEKDAKIVDHIRYQTETDLKNLAQQFATWQEFMEYFEAPFIDEGMAAMVPQDATTSWYQNYWETANEITPTTEEMQQEKENEYFNNGREDTDPVAKDAIFLSEIKSAGRLEAFLKQIDEVMKIDADDWANEAVDEQDREDAENIRKVQQQIRALHNQAFVRNSLRVAGGKPLSDKMRKNILTAIRNATRSYRGIYATVMSDERFTVDEDQEKAAINELAERGKKAGLEKDPTLMSPTERIKYADDIREKEIAEEIRSGKFKYDEEAEFYIKRQQKALKQADKDFKEYKAKIDADFNDLGDVMQRDLMKLYGKLLEVKNELEYKKMNVPSRLEANIRDVGKYNRDLSALQDNYTTLYTKYKTAEKAIEINAEFRQKLDHMETYQKAKAEYKQLRREQKAIDELKEIRKKLVKRTMRSVDFKNVEYEHAKVLIALQRIFDPNMRQGINKWIGIESVTAREIWSDYKTDEEERKRIIDILIKSPTGGELIRKLDQAKTERDFDMISDKDKKSLERRLAKSDWIKSLQLDRLKYGREQAIQLDIKEVERKLPTGEMDQYGNEKYANEMVAEYGDEIARLLEEYFPDDLITKVQAKPFQYWTIGEMEDLAKTFQDVYAEGRDALNTKKIREQTEAYRIRELIAKQVRDTGIVINEDDPEDVKKKKQEKIAKILGTSNAVKGLFDEKESRFMNKINSILHGYHDANIRRVARILDGYSEGTCTEMLYWKENECYTRQENSKNRRFAKVAAVMEENGIEVPELFRQVEIEYRGEKKKMSVDKLLFIAQAVANNEAYKAEQTKAGIAASQQEEESGFQAVVYGNLMTVEEKQKYIELDQGIKEEEEKRKADLILATQLGDEKQIKELQRVSLDTHDENGNLKLPGRDKIKAICKERLAKFMAEYDKLDPKFKKLQEAIAEDYSQEFERINRASVEEFNMPVWREKWYLPLIRKGATGDTHEARVRADLLGAVAGTGKAGTEKGFTQKRVRISPEHQTPVELGLYSTWADSVERNEHFINYASYVRELNRLFANKDAQPLMQEIQNRYGSGMKNYIDSYIKEVANPNAGEPVKDFDKVIRLLRGSTAPAYLGFKASSVLKQALSSPAPFMQFVSPVEYAKAAMRCVKPEVQEAIQAKSVFMRNRVFDPIVDVVNEQKNNATSPLVYRAKEVLAKGMQPLEWIDWACVAPGWLAVYEKERAALLAKSEAMVAKRLAELKELNDSGLMGERRSIRDLEAQARAETDDDIETMAVNRADDATRLCQPSNRKVDLAPMFKNGSELQKAVLQFQTALNVIWQNIRYDLPYAVRTKQYKQIVGMTMGYVMAGIAMGLLADGLGDDDEDEAQKVRNFVWYSTTQFTDSMPIVGSMVTATAEKVITGQAGYQTSNDIFPTFTKVKEGTFALTDENYRKAAAKYAEATALTLGLPTSGAKEAARAFGIGDGDGQLEFYPEAFMGRRKEN